MIKCIEFMNEQGMLLENEYLQAVILPNRGGKAASLFCKETKMEILFQNPKGKYEEASLGSDFSKFEACGFDEAFPNVDAEVLEWNGRRLNYPDHGEIWSSAFIAEASEGQIKLTYFSKEFQYRYEKTFSLDGKRLNCSYKIVNTGRTELPCIWTMHCLVNTTPKMQLIFPPDTERVQNVFDCALLDKAETIYAFPEDRINGKSYRFDRMPGRDMVKYYVAGAVQKGYCGYDYPETNTSVRILYDEKKLPYLGCWITEGGYRGDKNCALEPCTGYYDSIGTAKRLMGSVPVLRPGKPFEFSVAIEAGCLKKN